MIIQERAPPNNHSDLVTAYRNNDGRYTASSISQSRLKCVWCLHFNFRNYSEIFFWCKCARHQIPVSNFNYVCSTKNSVPNYLYSSIALVNGPVDCPCSLHIYPNIVTNECWASVRLSSRCDDKNNVNEVDNYAHDSLSDPIFIIITRIFYDFDLT